MKRASVPKSKSRKMETVIHFEPEFAGLCSCCKTSQTCTFLKDQERPDLQCEEFDGLLRSPLKMVPRTKIVPGRPHKASVVMNNTAGSFHGLCGLCEIHETCTFPKPEGGVWHCEEYQ